MVLVEMSRLLSMVSKFAVYVQARDSGSEFIHFVRNCARLTEPSRALLDGFLDLFG